jgi:hypothetical protein
LNPLTYSRYGLNNFHDLNLFHGRQNGSGGLSDLHDINDFLGSRDLMMQMKMLKIDWVNNGNIENNNMPSTSKGYTRVGTHGDAECRSSRGFSYSMIRARSILRIKDTLTGSQLSLLHP